MFNGGRYGDTNLDFEEYLLVLNSKANRFGIESQRFSEMLRASTEIYHSLGEVLKESGYDTDTGSEGGYAPDMDSSIQALELITAATISAAYDPKLEARLGIKIGSGALYNELESKYVFALDSNHFSSSNLIGLYNEWLCRFSLVYLEDPVASDDNEGWRQASEELGAKLILAGNDIFASQSERLRPALKEGIANSVVIIPSEAGTLTESLECLKLARRHNYRIVIGSRCGETNDDFMADLAVASAADYFKGGAPARGERVAKWNRLLILENILYGHK
jgi:enolase